MFRRLPPICINGDADAYYRSIATLQGNQLRGLVSDSLTAFVDFFRQYVAVEGLDPQGDTLLWAVPAAFNLDLLIAEEGGRQVGCRAESLPLYPHEVEHSTPICWCYSAHASNIPRCFGCCFIQ